MLRVDGEGGTSMTEIVTCAKCHCKFERTCEENEDGVMEAVLRPVRVHPLIEERHLVCEECQHEFLAWTGCMPIV